MRGLQGRSGWWTVAVLGLLLAGCASKTGRQAPVEERGPQSASVAADPTPSSAPPKPLPGAENAGKPGYYTVKPGDTLIRIGLESGQNWRDLVRWNGLDNPNLIEVGQVLRVVPPSATVAESGAVSRPWGAPRLRPRMGPQTRRPRLQPRQRQRQRRLHLLPPPPRRLHPLKMTPVSCGPQAAPCWLVLMRPRTRAWIWPARRAILSWLPLTGALSMRAPVCGVMAT